MAIRDRFEGIPLTPQSYRNASIREKEKLLGLVLVAPSVLLIALIIIYPLFYNIYLSFHDVPLRPGEAPVWNDFAHFEWLLNSSRFWGSLWTTIVFTLCSTTLATAGGLAVSLLLNRKFRGRRFARGLMLLPYVLPIIAVAFTWRWMFNTVFGVVPYLFRQVGLTELGRTSLLVEQGTALPMVILFNAWRYFPFAFLLIFARVRAIPDDMYEAAEIDGAGTFAQFKDITLPELKYVLGTVFLLRAVWNFNKYADVWLLTNEVDVLSVFTYQTAFSSLLQGRAAAISMVIFMFLISFVLVYVSLVMDW